MNMTLATPPAPPGFARYLGWSLFLHGVAILLLLAMEFLWPQPNMLRDPLQVVLLAPGSDVSTPEPPPADPRWQTLQDSAEAVERAPVPSLADAFESLADAEPDAAEPAPTPPPQPTDWAARVAAARARSALPPEVAELAADAAEQESAAEVWQRIQRQSTVAQSRDENPEVARFWERLGDAAGARRLQSQGAGGHYRAMIERMINSRWSPPDVARDQNLLVVVLAFRVLSGGAVESVRVVRPSVSDLFDQAAVRSVLLSAPLPRFPRDMTERSVDIRFTFTLDRDDTG